eukprot:2453186-Rhodomonas_salina.2
MEKGSVSVRFPIALRARYGMPCTVIAHAMSDTHVGPIVLRSWYALSGTNSAYAGTLRYLPTHSLDSIPVLTSYTGTDAA